MAERTVNVRPATAARRRALVLAAGAVAVTTIGYGLSTNRRLGVPLPPFSAKPDSSIGPLAIAAFGVLALAVAGGRWWLRRPDPGRWSPLALWLGTIAVWLAVNAARADGVAGWTKTFDLDAPEGPLEYLAGRDALAYGPGHLIDRFAELVPSLPVHVAGHPPGLLLVIDGLGITSAAGLAALCVGAGAVSAPLTYALARELTRDERLSRAAALLFVVAPGPILIGATSADALYMTLALAACVPLLARSAGGGGGAGAGRVAGGALVLAVASLFSWALLAAGAFAVAVRALRSEWRAAATVAAACAVATVGLHALLAVAAGWDPIGTIRETSEVYRFGIASARPYAYWVFGSPVAALLFAGLPLALAALAAAARNEPVALALAAVILVAAVAGFSKAETERIWLFTMPWLCIAAATAIPPNRHTAVLAALAAQALAVQLLVDTVW